MMAHQRRPDGRHQGENRAGDPDRDLGRGGCPHRGHRADLVLRPQRPVLTRVQADTIHLPASARRRAESSSSCAPDAPAPVSSSRVTLVSTSTVPGSGARRGRSSA